MHIFFYIILAIIMLICDEAGCSDMNFDPPGYGKYKTQSVSKIEDSSQWYGTVTVSDYEGDWPEVEGEYEAVAYIMDDIETEQPFFEIRCAGLAEEFFSPDENGEVDSLILSTYIKLDDKEFYPRVNEIEGDNAVSWILLTDLEKRDSVDFRTYLQDGILTGTYDYECYYEDDYGDGYEEFKITYEFARIKHDEFVEVYEQ